MLVWGDYYRRLELRESHRNEVRSQAGWTESASEQWTHTAKVLSTHHPIHTRKIHPASEMPTD